MLASKDQLVARNKKDASSWYPEIVEALQKVRGSFILDVESCLLDEERDLRHEPHSLSRRRMIDPHTAPDAPPRSVRAFSGAGIAFRDARRHYP